MTDTDLHVEAISAEVLEGDAAWWRIYERSFPKDEREPADVIRRSLQDGLGTAIRMRRATGVRQYKETVGIATLQYLPDSACLFLVYLAVDEGQRGSGLGGQLFSETLRIGCARHGGAPLDLVWEVDDPATAANGPETWKRERRLRFFGHQGGLLLPCAYKQPAVDRVAPVPMRLMWKPRAGAKDAFEGDPMALVSSIYYGKYGPVNGIPVGELDALFNGLDR
jgi:hypothetical protein